MKKMRKRNEGETLWAYINEWFKQYWWLSLIIQAVISCIYCGIMYLAVNDSLIELKTIAIIYFFTAVCIIFQRVTIHAKFKSSANWSFLALYIMFNLLQIILLFITIF